MGCAKPWLWIVAFAAAAAATDGVDGAAAATEDDDGCEGCFAFRSRLQAALRGQLDGRHLRIVTVPDPPFVIVPYKNGAPTAVPMWGGLCTEMLVKVAARANFTYDLVLPTGAKEGTPDYGQGQRDVEAGLADVYLGAYFVTPGRLATTRMTSPYVPSRGIGIAVEWQDPEVSLDQAMWLVFEPFQKNLWIVLFATLFLVTPLAFWLLEAQGRARGSDFDDNPGSASRRLFSHRIPEGKPMPRYSFKSLGNNYLISAWLTWSTFTGAHAHTPATPEGRALSMSFTFVTLTMVSIYTANLAAMLSQSAPSYEYTSLDEMVAYGGQRLCAKANTAYHAWLEETYAQADVAIVGSEGGFHGMMRAMRRGDCDAVADVGSFVEYYAKSTYCRSTRESGFHGLYYDEAQDISVGYQDFGIGVGFREDLEGVSAALSYHVMALRGEGTITAMLDGELAGTCGDPEMGDGDGGEGEGAMRLRSCSGIFIMYDDRRRRRRPEEERRRERFRSIVEISRHDESFGLKGIEPESTSLDRGGSKTTLRRRYGVIAVAALAVRAAKALAEYKAGSRTLLSAIVTELKPAARGGRRLSLGDANHATREAALAAWTRSPRRRAAICDDIKAYVRAHRIETDTGRAVVEADWAYWAAQLRKEDDANALDDDADRHDHSIRDFVLETLLKPVLLHVFLTAPRDEKVRFHVASRETKPRADSSDPPSPRSSPPPPQHALAVDAPELTLLPPPGAFHIEDELLAAHRRRAPDAKRESDAADMFGCMRPSEPW